MDTTSAMRNTILILENRHCTENAYSKNFCAIL